MLKFVPMMVTDVPTGPEVGEKDVTVGTATAELVKRLAIDPRDVPALLCPTAR